MGAIVKTLDDTYGVVAILPDNSATVYQSHLWNDFAVQIHATDELHFSASLSGVMVWQNSNDVRENNTIN